MTRTLIDDAVVSLCLVVGFSPVLIVVYFTYVNGYLVFGYLVYGYLTYHGIVTRFPTLKFPRLVTSCQGGGLVAAGPNVFDSLALCCTPHWRLRAERCAWVLPFPLGWAGRSWFFIGYAITFLVGSLISYGVTFLVGSCCVLHQLCRHIPRWFL